MESRDGTVGWSLWSCCKFESNVADGVLYL
jgi:hypothetical protein